jgi:hypothetical protein
MLKCIGRKKRIRFIAKSVLQLLTEEKCRSGNAIKVMNEKQFFHPETNLLLFGWL